MKARLLPILLPLALVATGLARADDSDLREQLANAQTAGDARAIQEIAIRLLESNPDDVVLLAARCDALQRLRDEDALDKALAEVPPAHLEHPEFRAVLARRALRMEERAEARTQWLAVLEAKEAPREALLDEGYGSLIRAASRVGDWADVEDFATRWLGPGPKLEARLARSRAHLMRRDLEKAREDLEEARKIDPTDREVRRWTPVVERFGFLAPKLVPLDEEIAGDPKAVPPRFERGSELLANALPALAVEDFRAAHALLPESHALLIAHGMAHYALHGSLPEGSPLKSNRSWRSYDQEYVDTFRVQRSQLRKLLDLELSGSQDAETFIERIDAVNFARQGALSLPLGREALRLSKGSPAGYVAAIKAHTGAREFTSGAKLAEEAVARYPKDHRLWMVRGALLAQEGDHLGAIKSLDRSIELKETSSNMYLRSESHRLKGNKGLYQRDWKRFQELKR